MGSARTRGQKKRAKRGHPRVEGVEREPNGRASRKGRQYVIPPEKRDATRRVGLEARCRMMGWQVNRETLADAAAEHLGCEAGRAIHGHRDQAVLWATIKLIAGVYARYVSVLGLPNPYPATANLTILPEPVGSDGVDATGGYDDRPIEDRVRTATSAVMAIEGALMEARAVSEVKAAVLRDEPVRDLAKLVEGLKAVEARMGSGG